VKRQQAVKVSDYLAPRFWFTWIAIGVMRAVAWLPLAGLVAVGSVVGQLYYWLAPGRRRVGEINLRIAFPDLSSAKLRELNRAGFRNLGVGLFELGLAWWETDRVLAMYETDGLEHLQAAQQRGSGVIILTAHFTCLEVGGPILNQHVPFQAVYKAPHNPLFAAFMAHARAGYTHAIINYHKPIGLIKGLKKGHAMWYAPDQDFGQKDTVFVPFFGVPATALTAPARIAKISGAAVVPYYIARKPRGRGYRLTFLPPLQNFPCNDPEQDALVINRVIEKMILQNPRQYLWSHKRYKNRPDGRRGMYPPFAASDSTAG